MITFILTSLTYIALSGFLYRVRGGGIPALDYRVWNQRLGVSIFPRNSVWVGLTLLPWLTTGFLYLNGYAFFNAAIIAQVIGLAYMGYVATGWGAYFDMGTWPTDRAQVGFIDKILLKVYGPSNLNDYAQRRKRDILGMGLRMGVFAPIYFLPVLATEYYLTYGLTIGMFDVLYVAGVTLIMSALSYLITYVYAFFVNQKAAADEQAQAVRNSLTGKSNPWYYGMHTKAEIVTGAYLALLTIIVLFFI